MFGGISTTGAQAIGAILSQPGMQGMKCLELLRAGMHGSFQGTIAMAQGGKFIHGFAAGALGSLAGSYVPEELQLISAAAIGGKAAAISGGKFANGAITAAYVVLFNHQGHNSDNDEQAKNKNNNTNSNNTDKDNNEFGKIKYSVNISAILSPGGGLGFEFGFVVTDTGYVQYYITFFETAGIAAGVSANLAFIYGLKGIEPTLLDWKGETNEIGMNAGYFTAQQGMGGKGTYATTTFGVGPGVSFPPSGTGFGATGTTYFIGKPIPPNNEPNVITNWYIRSGGHY